MAQAVQQQQVQELATALNIDWNRVWNVVQKLSPALQQIIMILLQESQGIPNIVGSDGPAITEAEAQAAANAQGLNLVDVMALVEKLGPILGKLLIAFLTRTSSTIV